MTPLLHPLLCSSSFNSDAAGSPRDATRRVRRLNEGESHATSTTTPRDKCNSRERKSHRVYLATDPRALSAHCYFCSPAEIT